MQFTNLQKCISLYARFTWFFFSANKLNEQNVWWKQISQINLQLFLLSVSTCPLRCLWTACKMASAGWHARTIITHPMESNSHRLLSMLFAGLSTFSLSSLPHPCMMLPRSLLKTVYGEAPDSHLYFLWTFKPFCKIRLTFYGSMSNVLLFRFF